MSLHWRCAVSQLTKVFGRFRSCHEVSINQTLFYSKWSHSGSFDNDENMFLEDTLEERINADGTQFLNQQHKTRRMSTKKELEMERRRFVKRKIIQKKEKALYTPKQPTLLTWAAKSQILYLHKKDPIYWTPDMLAQSFPVSREVIIKMLKNNPLLPRDDDYIFRHDQRVYLNWLKLKKAKEDFIEGRPVDPEFRCIVESENTSLMMNAAGSRALPVPASGFLTQKALAEKRRPKTKGEFSAILEDYEKQKEAIKEEESVKHIELEDPNYTALLTSISDMTVKEDIPVEENRLNQEKITLQQYPGQDNSGHRWGNNLKLDALENHKFERISRSARNDKPANADTYVQNNHRSGSFNSKLRFGSSDYGKKKETKFRKKGQDGQEMTMLGET